jgi:hypothetical protein
VEAKHDPSLSACMLVFLGCSTRHEPEIRTQKQMPDGTGRHRLLLKIVETSRSPDSVSFDFHSLVWESKDGDTWSEKSVITRADFEMGTERRRRITDLHSFDAAKGIAVVKVFEEEAREADGPMQYEVSWREWDLVNNRQVQFWRDRSGGANTYEQTVADNGLPAKKP